MEKNEAQNWADDLNEKEKIAFRRMCIMISNYDDLCQELLNENEKLRNAITHLQAKIYELKNVSNSEHFDKGGV